jgi:hypothetical protein
MLTDDERQLLDDLRDTTKLALSDAVPIETILLMLRVRAGTVLGRGAIPAKLHELLDDPERGPILAADFELMALDPDPAVAQATRDLVAALAAEPR